MKIKKKQLLLLAIYGLCLSATAQQVKFTEYDLDNGLHVILHSDKTAPVVAVSVMYHVGSKDEDPQRTGFAHFFEHLLFEGSKNIKRGEFFKLVSSNGGQNNANTSTDRTFYYEAFPSNQLELGLWLESERMLHPIIDEVGLKTQNKVIKEEKSSQIDNVPYRGFLTIVFAKLFEGHPYSWPTIGKMEHLDAASLADFQAFFKKYYAPNNAVITIAGDIDVEKTKSLIDKYFSEIPKGTPLVRPASPVKPITKQIIDTAYDVNIKIPAIFAAYRVPGLKSRESKVLDMIATVLTGGPSSRLNQKMVDDKKNAMTVESVNLNFEDYGIYVNFAMPNNNTPLNELLADIDEGVLRMQNELISDLELQKLQNMMEDGYVSANTSMIGLAENLSNGYTFENKNTGAINQHLKEIQTITREEIRDVARKYLKKEERALIYYLPKK